MAVNSRTELTVSPWSPATPPATDDQGAIAYLMRELQRLRATVSDLVDAAPQATNAAPLRPRNGMVRYAEGAWATALGGTGAYVYLNGVWTLISPITGTWTPTLSAQTGTLTSATATGRYWQIGSKLVVFQVQITITTNGTAAGDLRFTLPIAAAGGVPVNMFGREAAVAGKSIGGGAASSTVAALVNYDNTYPGVNGGVYQVAGLYLSA